jgi:hypothetical protein
MADHISTFEELEQQVTLNPYDEKGYPPVLEHYQDNEEDTDGQIHQKLEKLRVQYALYCNPPPPFWISWLTDCVIVANKDNSYIQKVRILLFLQKILHLFDFFTLQPC